MSKQNGGQQSVATINAGSLKEALRNLKDNLGDKFNLNAIKVLIPEGQNVDDYMQELTNDNDFKELVTGRKFEKVSEIKESNPELGNKIEAAMEKTKPEY